MTEILNTLILKASGIWCDFLSELTAARAFGEFGTFLEMSFVVNGLVFAWPGLTERYRNNLKEQLSNHIQGPISDVLDGRSGTEGQESNHTSRNILKAADTFLEKFEDSVQAVTLWSKRFAIVMMVVVAAMLYVLGQEFDVGWIFRILFLLAMIGPGGCLLGLTKWIFWRSRRKCKNQFGYLGDGDSEHDPLEARERLDAAIKKRKMPTVPETS